MPPVGLEKAQAAVQQLFLLMQAAGTYGPKHPSTDQAATAAIKAIAQNQLPLVLQFVGPAVFRDKELLPFDSQGYLNSQRVARALDALGAHEVTFDVLPPKPSLIRLGAWLARAAGGTGAPPESLELPGLRLREIPGARAGRTAEDVDPEVACALHLALAVRYAETAVARRGEPWSWNLGMSVVRRLEQGLTTSHAALARALEIAPGTWSPARRAVSTAFRFLDVSRSLDIPLLSARAGAHGLLVAGCTGFGAGPDGADLPLVETARAALRRTLDSPRVRSAHLAPHRVRVSALLDALARLEGEPAEWSGVPGLCQVLFDLESRRCPAGVDFTLTYGDLLAHAVEAMGESYDPWSVRALVHAAGAIPPGSRVMLPDGRAGIVLDAAPQGDALRPRVLVGAEQVVPDLPVSLLGPAPRPRAAP